MTGRPEGTTLFAALPVVLRFLRLEHGETCEALDAALELPAGTYRSFEAGSIRRLPLAILERLLAHFDLALAELDHRLEAMREVRWPPGAHPPTRAGDEEGVAAEAPEIDRAPAPSAEDFLRAWEVIRELEWYPLPRRWRPPQHGFATVAEAVRWLRGFLRLSEAELASTTGVATSTIRTLEAGRREPARETRQKIGRNVQPLYNDLLAAAGTIGVPPFWNPPQRSWTTGR